VQQSMTTRRALEEGGARGGAVAAWRRCSGGLSLELAVLVPSGSEPWSGEALAMAGSR
jgi:hypothetical protein